MTTTVVDPEGRSRDPGDHAVESATTIERRSGLSHRQFMREHVLPLKPVILTDAAEGWPALKKWTPRYLADRFGSHEVHAQKTAHRLGEAIERIVRSTAQSPAPYVHNVNISRELPELLADLRPLYCYRPNWLARWWFPAREPLAFFEFFVGGPGAAFPSLHFDNYYIHAFLTQIHGEKEFICFPPDQSAYVYPGVGKRYNTSQLGDVEHPDLQQFPLFRQARPLRFTLRAGETIFVPAGWWHTTRMHTVSITVSLNTANWSDWRAFTSEYGAEVARRSSRIRGRAVSAYLALLGYLEHAAEMLSFFA